MIHAQTIKQWATNMALSSEDKGDIKGAMGKAMANKVAGVTRDKLTRKFNTSYGTMGGGGYGYKSKAEQTRARNRTAQLVPGGTGRIHPLQKKLMALDKQQGKPKE